MFHFVRTYCIAFLSAFGVSLTVSQQNMTLLITLSRAILDIVLKLVVNSALSHMAS